MGCGNSQAGQTAPTRALERAGWRIARESLARAASVAPPRGLQGHAAQEGAMGQPQYFREARQVILRGVLTKTREPERTVLHTNRPPPHPIPASVAPVPRGSPGEDGYDATLVS